MWCIVPRQLAGGNARVGSIWLLVNNANKSFSFFPPSFRSYGNNHSRIETNYDKESVFESVIKQSLRTIQITGGASATNSITLVDYWKVVAFLSLLPPIRTELLKIVNLKSHAWRIITFAHQLKKSVMKMLVWCLQ